MNRLTAIVTAIILFTGIWAFHSVSTLPGHFHGDEIHYLAITLSLLRDRDLNVLNNYASEELVQMGGAGTLPHLIYSENGTGYSSHSPGLPVLLVLPYALAGRTGIVFFLSLIGVAAAMQVFYMAKSIQARTDTAVLMTLITGFNLPFLMMSGKIFPDIAAALFLSLGVRWLLIDTRAHRPVTGCLCLAVLPWLHVKYAVFLALVFVFYLVCKRPRPGQLVYSVLPVIASMTALAGFYLFMFGDVFYMLKVKGGGFGNPYPGMAGLLFDREAGLLVFAPVFIPAFIALLFQWRRSLLLNATACVVISHWVISGAWIDWHSGHCPPARYLIPVLPLLSVFMCSALARPSLRGGKYVIYILWFMSLLQIAGIALTIPENAIVRYDGINRLWNHVSPGYLEYAAPSFLNPGPGTLWSFSGMLVFSVSVAVLMFFYRMSTPVRTVFAVLLLAGSGSLVTAGVVKERAFWNQLALTPLAEDGPELKTPRDGTVWWGRFPDLEWSPVAGAEGYYYIIEFPDGQRLEVPLYNRTRVLFTEGITEVFPMGRYCVSVIPFKHSNRGTASEKHCFELR